MGSHPTARRRLAGVLMLAGALVGLILTAAGFVGLFGGTGSTVPGVIHSGGHQILQLHTGGGYTTTQVAYVDVRLDDGTTHQVESEPLYQLWKAAPGDLSVDVQLDSNGIPKRIRYHGHWYGAGPPIWFWIGFTLVAGLATVGLLVGGVRRVRARAGTPSGAPSGAAGSV